MEELMEGRRRKNYKRTLEYCVSRLNEILQRNNRSSYRTPLVIIAQLSLATALAIQMFWGKKPMASAAVAQSHQSSHR